MQPRIPRSTRHRPKADDEQPPRPSAAHGYTVGLIFVAFVSAVAIILSSYGLALTIEVQAQCRSLASST